MKKLFVLLAVAVLAMSVFMTGCRKSQSTSENTKHEDKDEDRYPAGLQNVAKDFCKSSGYLGFMKENKEFMTRATWQAGPSGGESIEDYLKLVNADMRETDFPWKSCETEAPRIMKCDDAFTEITMKHSEMKLNKMTSAFKEMGLSYDDCASMKVTVSTDDPRRKEVFKIFLAKGKSDKWEMIGDDRFPHISADEGDYSLMSLQKDICDNSKMMGFMSDYMELAGRATYDKNMSGGKSVEDFVKEMRRYIRPEDVAWESCRAEIPRKIRCDEAYSRMAAANNGIPADKIKIAAREMDLSDTECGSMLVTASTKTTPKLKTSTVFFAQGLNGNMVLLGTDDKPEPPSAEAAPSPAPEAAPAPGATKAAPPETPEAGSPQ